MRFHLGLKKRKSLASFAFAPDVSTLHSNACRTWICAAQGILKRGRVLDWFISVLLWSFIFPEVYSERNPDSQLSL